MKSLLKSFFILLSRARQMNCIILICPVLISHRHALPLVTKTRPRPFVALRMNSKTAGDWPQEGFGRRGGSLLPSLSPFIHKLLRSESHKRHSLCNAPSSPFSLAGGRPASPTFGMLARLAGPLSIQHDGR